MQSHLSLSTSSQSVPRFFVGFKQTNATDYAIVNELIKPAHIDTLQDLNDDLRSVITALFDTSHHNSYLFATVTNSSLSLVDLPDPADAFKKLKDGQYYF